MLSLLWIVSARAQVDPACVDIATGEPPSWYVDDQHQQDYLLNFFSLATTLSPLHAPVPDEPGHGSLSLELSVIPPLSCDRRLVLARSKTEETNKTPMLPRPRGTFTFPAIGRFALYAGIAYDPPVTLFGTRNVIASGEVGVGYLAESGFELGGRYHYTLMKTIAEIAGPFDPDPHLTTNSAGNFYTNKPIAFPFSASIEVGGDTLTMTGTPSVGGCSSCHQCGGEAGGKLYGP